MDFTVKLLKVILWKITDHPVSFSTVFYNFCEVITEMLAKSDVEIARIVGEYMQEQRKEAQLAAVDNQSLVSDIIW